MLLAAELIHMTCSPYIRGESVRLPAIAVGMCVLVFCFCSFFLNNNESELGKECITVSIISAMWRGGAAFALLSWPTGETLAHQFSIFTALSVVFHTFSLYLCFIVV